MVLFVIAIIWLGPEGGVLGDGATTLVAATAVGAAIALTAVAVVAAAE